MRKSGTLWGIHAEGSSEAVPVMRRWAGQGVYPAVVLAVHNPGLCVEAKTIHPDILTVARFLHPDPEFEYGGAGVQHWDQARRARYVREAVQLIFDNTNPTEFAACDYFQSGINEWHPKGQAGALAFGEILGLLCDRATERGVKLCVPGFNAGTLNYDEFEWMASTGVFGKMKAGGHILNFHEGVFFDQPIDFGRSQGIDGAPFTLPNASPWCFRSDYLYHILRQRGEVVPCVMGEWYDGNRRSDPPAKRLAAMKWYDRQARLRPWVLGFCAFELSPQNPSNHWWAIDFTPTYQSDALLADMLAEKDKPNPTGADDMPNAEIRQLADEIITRANRIKELAADPVLYRARLPAARRVRDAAGAPLVPDVLLAAGTEVSVYNDPLETIGGWQDRAIINKNGESIWGEGLVRL